MSRLLPSSLTLVAVTALLVAYGSHTWSWLGGPLAALLVLELDRLSRGPAPPAAARARSRVAIHPDPVD